ncbi:MAG TPA: phosphotransferase family protein [Acidimicrobiia bacterium]|nr:phosphotransferase family protein [Acidimicrobiia bacterium]
MTDATGALPGLDAARVASWMVEHVPAVVAPVEFRLIGGGHSNLTYAADDAAGRSLVVRRPPLGTRGGNAHDMGREHRALTALFPTVVPVAEPLALCTDESVNGAAFYVMDHVDGHVVDNPSVAASALPTPELRRRASEQIVDVLADLHRVDVDAVGLGDAAKREAFLERQLRRMYGVWEQTKTRELPLIDELHDRLVAAAPPQRYTGIVHSDYRFGNVILGAEGDLLAVLDWELWTLGDVLADVGFILNNWYEPGDDAPQVWMEVPPTLAGGFAGRDEVVARYVERTGFDLDDVEYYRAFQHWKVAILAEGVKRRYESATMATSDVDFEHLARRVVDLADLADAHLSRS